jgi:CheY-like chemotaxis protein
MGAPFRILTVDNEPSIPTSLRYVFAGPRFELFSVDSGEAALARLVLLGAPWDLIIVDQKMPSLTGVELVQEIRARGIPGKIIVISAHVSPEIRQAYERMEVHAILPKPFDLVELRAAVHQLVSLTSDPLAV